MKDIKAEIEELNERVAQLQKLARKDSLTDPEWSKDISGVIKTAQNFFRATGKIKRLQEAEHREFDWVVNKFDEFDKYKSDFEEANRLAEEAYSAKIGIVWKILNDLRDMK